MSMKFSAEMISAFLGGTVDGDKSVTVNTVAKIEEGTKDALAFLSNPKYEEYIYTTAASIVIVNADFAPKQPVKATMIRVPNAYEAFAKLLQLYVQNLPKKVGISPKSDIAESAKVGKDVYIGAFAVIDEGAQIGDGTQIFPQVYIGDNVKIGSNCIINAGVKIYAGCVIGDNTTIHAGTIVGGDGFGFAPRPDGGYDKIPQIGNVVIGSNVEIGANTCIDRATMGSTRISDGVKLDNLIQIAHNVVIGENTVMASQVGVAGSAKIGKNSMFGGQVGIVGHITLADGLKVGSKTGISTSIDEPNSTWFGVPMLPGLKQHRVMAIIKELPDLRYKLMEIDRELKKIKENK